MDSETLTALRERLSDKQIERLASITAAWKALDKRSIGDVADFALENVRFMLVQLEAAWTRLALAPEPAAGQAQEPSEPLCVCGHLWVNHGNLGCAHAGCPCRRGVASAPQPVPAQDREAYIAQLQASTQRLVDRNTGNGSEPPPSRAQDDPPTPIDCAVQAINSRVCSHGTKGCVVKHERAQDGPEPSVEPLADIVRRRIAEHGGIRATSRALGVDAAYLIRLRDGEKERPSWDTLGKLAIRETTTYEDLRRRP